MDFAPFKPSAFLNSAPRSSRNSSRSRNAKPPSSVSPKRSFCVASSLKLKSICRCADAGPPACRKLHWVSKLDIRAPAAPSNSCRARRTTAEPCAPFHRCTRAETERVTILPVLRLPESGSVFSRQKSSPAMSPWPHQSPRCQAWSCWSPARVATGQPRESSVPSAASKGNTNGLSHSGPKKKFVKSFPRKKTPIRPRTCLVVQSSAATAANGSNNKLRLFIPWNLSQAEHRGELPCFLKVPAKGDSLQWKAPTET